MAHNRVISNKETARMKKAILRRPFVKHFIQKNGVLLLYAITPNPGNPILLTGLKRKFRACVYKIGLF